MNRIVPRLFLLLLMPLLLGVNVSAWARVRPENRVWENFPTPSKTASECVAQVVEGHQESGGIGCETASGVHKYLYCKGNPINGWDPSGHDDIGGMLGAMDITGILDGFNSIVGKVKSLLVGGGAPGTGHATVHIWSYRGKHEAWGHASLTLDDDPDKTHISWWPSGVGRVSMPFLPNVYSAPANDPQTFNDDMTMEADHPGIDPPMPPDKNIVITSLDEKKIKTWWSGFKTTHLWKTLSQNCSTTVADALKAGDASRAHSILGSARLQWGSHNIIWNPAKVEAYANEINQYH